MKKKSHLHNKIAILTVNKTSKPYLDLNQSSVAISILGIDNIAACIYILQSNAVTTESF